MIYFRLLALVSVALGAVCAYEGWRVWRGWSSAGLLPAITAVLLLFMAGAFLVQAKDSESLSFPSASELRSTAIVATSFAAYMVCVSVIGYFLSTWLVLFFLTKTTSDASTRTAIIWPGLLAAGSLYLFRSVGAHLPSGMLDF